jgi:pSer/pThr/pTyr-binding forkhead associated (FHA) protein
MLVSYLEIVEGASAGSRFRIREGLRIGRTTGEILLDDPKVSSLHAQIEKDNKGSYILMDRDSANGLRINGQKVKRVAMLPGVKFHVGKTLLQVVEAFEEGAEELPPLAEAEKPKTWREVLAEEIPRLPLKNLDSVMRVEAFRPALQLDFIQGVQMEHQLLLGYGPRRFGSDVLDVELQEPLCPPLAFEILSENGEAVFQTQYPKLVLLNNTPTATAPLKEGDHIRIGQTIIRVSFAS